MGLSDPHSVPEDMEEFYFSLLEVYMLLWEL